MTGNTHRKRGWPIALLALAVAFATRTAPAQDDEEEVEEAPVAAVVAAPNTFVLSESVFNSWVFFGDFGDASTDSIRSRIRSSVNMQIAEMQRVCGLTEAQEAKLQLAGRGDFKRFFGRVEEKRRKLQGKTYDQNKISEIFQEVRPLRESLISGLFEGDALFAKVATRLLDAQQRERYEEVRFKRRAYQYAALVDLAVIEMSRVMGLSASQQKRLGEVILRETRTPRRIGQVPQPIAIVYLEMSRIPKEKLQPIFDEAQWSLIQQYQQSGQMMQQSLKQYGYVAADEEDEDDTEAKADVNK